MSAPQSRLKERLLPLGGTAHSAKGAHLPAGPSQGARPLHREGVCEVRAAASLGVVVP